MKSDWFETELSYIHDEKLRYDTKEFLEKYVPEYFYHVPASSTGKYHPAYALGEGGLMRHTKAAVHIAEMLLSIDQYKDLEHDAIIVALLLHDTFKSGEEQSRYTRFDHPLIAAEAVNNYADISKNIYFRYVATLIVSHMGQWCEDEKSGIKLPKPRTPDQKFVHLCDYLASRKSITVCDVG